MARVYLGRIKQLLLIFCLSLLGLANSARANNYSALSVDTVAGHARMVRKLSAQMCTLIAKDEQSPSFKQLTPQAAQEMIGRLFTTAFMSDSVAVLAMMSDAAKQNMNPNEVGRQLGSDVVGVLGHDCPASLPLIALLSKTEMAQKAAAANAPALSAAEQKALQLVVNKVCTDLAASDAKVSFASRTPDQRQALLSSLIEGQFKASRPQLLRYYSAAQLADEARVTEIIKKMCGLMLQQDSCAKYIMQIGADELAKGKK